MAVTNEALSLATDEQSADYLSFEAFNVQQNPLAMGLWHQQGWFGDVLSYEGEAVSVEIDAMNGIVFKYPADPRPATDKEAASIEAVITVRHEKAFDSRRPLPMPIAKWLRSMADQIHAELYEAAANVEATEDTRDRKLVRRWIERDPAVKFDRTHGLVDVTKPRESWPQAPWELTDEERAAWEEMEKKKAPEMAVSEAH